MLQQHISQLECTLADEKHKSTQVKKEIDTLLTEKMTIQLQYQSELA